MLNQIHRLILVAALLAACTPVAQADLILGLRYSDGSTSKTVNSGDTVFLDVSLTDTDGSTFFPSEGLFSAGARLLQTAGSIVMGAPTTTDVDSNWAAGIFDSNPASAGGLTEIGKALGATDLFFGPAIGAVPGVSSTIRIARFAYTVTGAAGATATIASATLDSGVNTIVTFNTLTDLDGLVTSFGSVDLTISGAPAAVPEPASMILASLTAVVAGGAQYARRRRLRRTVQA